MKVQIDKSFPMPCSPEIAWEFLQNIEAVAGCMPGAKITERLDVGRYKGTVTTKVGPATMSFRGEVAMTEVDPTLRSLRLLGKGTDSTGSSGASMNLAARIETAEGGLSALVGASEISMSGKAAAFGGRMMSTVGDQILRQFADNFASQVSALQALRAPSATGGNSAPTTGSNGVPAAGGSGAQSTAAPFPAPTADPLNVVSLAWAIFKDWLRGLFAKKKV
jgi:carbon monoxide dehydrogenase subunit G